MTKKDYIKLAAALRALDTGKGGAVSLRAVVSVIADVLQADNSAFDRDRFETAARGK